MPETAPQAKPPAGPSDKMAAACGALLLIAVSLGVHAYEYPGSFHGSATWADQMHGATAARAWARWDLSPAEHHYPPYYPLLGALFVWLTPWQPFLVPDALCWAACLLLFVCIARRLAPGWPALISVLCFLAGTLGGRRLLELWVIPWTTTGVAPCQFGALLLALRFGEAPTRRRACVLGLAIGAAGGFRPSDAAVLLASMAPYAVWVLAARAPRVRDRCIIALAMAGGVAAGALPALAAHLAVYGTSAGLYLQASSATGFEWRLLPMRWVMLVVDSRPLLPRGLGMAEVFPWLLPGIGGLFLAVLPRRAGSAAPATLVAGTVMLHWLLYLGYRDLQPYGLWRFDNVHYFKWSFPVLVLWAAQLAGALLAPVTRGRAIGAAACCTLLVVWRPVLRDAAVSNATLDGASIVLPAGLSPLDVALRINLQGDWNALYFSFLPLHAGGRVFENTRDFKVLPVDGGAMLVPLRLLPPGAARLDLLPGVDAGLPVRAVTARQAIVPGMPCGLVWWQGSCRPAR